MVSGCRARIEITDPKPVYTCGDILEGRVHIVVNREIAVDEVVVKFRGKAKVALGDGKYRSLLFSDLHHDELVVFPPKELIDQQFATHFTLPRGEYSHPFHFEIPGHGVSSEAGSSYLLPTMTSESNERSIRYYLKVTVRRRSPMVLNTRTEVDVTTCPCIDRRVFECDTREMMVRTVTLSNSFASSVKSMFSTEPAREVRMQLMCHYPRQGVIANAQSALPLKVSVTATDLPSARWAAVLGSVRILLVTLSDYRTLTDTTRAKTKLPLYESTPNEPLIFTENSPVSLTRFMKRVTVPSTLIPTFESTLLDNNYALQVSLTFVYEVSGVKFRKTIDVMGDLIILPPFIHDHTHTTNDYIEEDFDLPRYEPLSLCTRPPDYDQMAWVGTC